MTDRRARRATRCCFFALGVAIACWAPLVPFVKARVGADAGTFGLLLVCLGIGSMLAMIVIGAIVTRFGARRTILPGGIAMAAMLPVLALMPGRAGLALALFGYGAALGAVDVAMNAHAVQVEQAADEPLMSGFHGFYSLGSFAGSGGMIGLLSAGLGPLPAVSCGAIAALVAILMAVRGLLTGVPPDHGRRFAWPNGIVLLLACLVAIAFLTEGAVLDWSAVLITQRGLAAPARAGLGYMLFAAAMTVGRFGGDAVVARAGCAAVLAGSGIAAATGFALVLAGPASPIALAGFVLVGLGASNIVPILMSAAGRQTAMPPALAVTAIGTVGYAGVLAGPALIGFVARLIGLGAAFWMIAALLLLVPILGPRAAPG